MTTVMLADGVRTPSKRTELLAVQGTLIGFAFVIVSLRLITRFYIVKSPGKDDYAIIFATVKRAGFLACLRTVFANNHTDYGDCRDRPNTFISKARWRTTQSGP